ETADDTWITPGKVGSRHNINKEPSSKGMVFFVLLGVRYEGLGFSR
ncbi:hypothetical protein CLV98_1251, partial [Dyadobacter jejuensis]